MLFPSKPAIGPNDKVVAFKCRRKPAPCDSVQAIARQPTPGNTQYVCVKCGNIIFVPQGGGISL